MTGGGIRRRATTLHGTFIPVSVCCEGCVAAKSIVNSSGVCHTDRKFAYAPGSSSGGIWISNAVSCC